MPRTSGLWWWKQADHYCATIRRKRHRLGKDKDAAEKKFHKLMSEPDDRVPPDTLVAIIDLFLDWTQKHRAPDTYLWYLKHLQSFKHSLKPALLRVDRLKAHHVENWIDSHDWGDSYQRGAMTAISRALNWAEKKGHIEYNPIRRKLDKPRPKKREVYITRDQFKEIVKHIDGDFLDLVMTAWETGCRPQEVTKVEARHVDLAKNRWVFPEEESKGRETKRIVYLSKKAMAITKRLMKTNPTGPLFLHGDVPWTRFEVSHAFGRLAKHVGFRYRLYDLRFSFCTNGLKKGVDPITMQHLMGHKDLQMISKIYALVSQDADHMQKAAMKATAR
jgi:integrase